MRLAISLAVLCLSAAVANAQGVPRGLGHPPGSEHWYDRDCCHDRDCEAVEPGAIRETPEGYFIRYMTSRGYIAEGFLPHGASGIRPSRDHQEHACAPQEKVVCIYIPMMM
jgi:hypothetical protein